MIRNKCTSIIGHLSMAMAVPRAIQTAQLQGYSGSHWTPPSGNYLLYIASAATRQIIFLGVSSSIDQRVKQILQHMQHFIFTIFVLSKVKNSLSYATTTKSTKKQYDSRVNHSSNNQQTHSPWWCHCRYSGPAQANQHSPPTGTSAAGVG